MQPEEANCRWWWSSTKNIYCVLRWSRASRCTLSRCDVNCRYMADEARFLLELPRRRQRRSNAPTVSPARHNMCGFQKGVPIGRTGSFEGNLIYGLSVAYTRPSSASQASISRNDDAFLRPRGGEEGLLLLRRPAGQQVAGLRGRRHWRQRVSSFFANETWAVFSTVPIPLVFVFGTHTHFRRRCRTERTKERQISPRYGEGRVQ